MYKLLFIGEPSIHLKNWISYFKENNCETYYLGFIPDFLEYNSILNKYLFIEPSCSKLNKIIKYKKYIKEISPDLILFHYADYKLFFSLFSKSIPFVICGYGYDIFTAPYKSYFFKKILKYFGNRAKLFLSIAEHMTEILVDYVGIKSNNIITSSWGCNTKVFYNNKNIKRNEKKIRVICPRGFESHYNWKTLIKAIPKVLKINSNYEFILTNTGREENQAKQLVEELNIQNKVYFLGKISPEKLAVEYNKSHIYVSMSLIDGNNISLNEAMNCGCFPICSNTDATRQWIKNNINGFLLNDNFSYEELSEKILSYEDKMDIVKSAEIKNYDIVNEKADFNKNLEKIEKIFRNL